MKNIFFIITAIILILAAYSYFIEPNIIKIEKKSFKLNFLKGKKAVHISDLHFNKKTKEKRVEVISEIIKKISPDLIFITGDLIERKEGIAMAKKMVSELSKISPVYIVLGNWDYYVFKSNIKDFKIELENSGAKVFFNETEKIKIGEEEFILSGVDMYSPKIEKCNILLAHSPSIIYQAAENNIDLVLAGHTHGGQVYIPFLTKTILPVPDKIKKFSSGLYNVGKTQIYVNRGLGTSTLPLRFMVPPEITIITFD